VRKDHRPYFVKKLQNQYVKWYTDRYLRPQFRHLGKSPALIRPWHVQVFGYSVEVGDYATIIAEPHSNVHFVSWAQADLEDLAAIMDGSDKRVDAKAKEEARALGQGLIKLGDYVLVCPGVRIQAATRITIGNGVMFAQGAYVTDADWHGIYDRCMPVGSTAPVAIGDNAWIGDHAIVCKGVTIGENSIIGAGSVVRRDVPANSIAAGNPCQVVKELDPERVVKGREAMFANHEELQKMLSAADKDAHDQNTLWGWLRYLLFPRYGD
jgi:acetyltransferase-like isoleucine patch superfamily enzyme